MLTVAERINWMNLIKEEEVGVGTGRNWVLKHWKLQGFFYAIQKS